MKYWKNNEMVLEKIIFYYSFFSLLFHFHEFSKKILNILLLFMDHFF